MAPFVFTLQIDTDLSNSSPSFAKGVLYTSKKRGEGAPTHPSLTFMGKKNGKKEFGKIKMCFIYAEESSVRAKALLSNVKIPCIKEKSKHKREIKNFYQITCGPCAPDDPGRFFHLHI